MSNSYDDAQLLDAMLKLLEVDKPDGKLRTKLLQLIAERVSGAEDEATCGMIPFGET